MTRAGATGLRAVVRPAALIVAASAMFGATSGAAQAGNYPWCLQSEAFEGSQHCSYSTFEQCLADRQGLGGFCNQNPMYGPAVPGRARRRP